MCTQVTENNGIKKGVFAFFCNEVEDYFFYVVVLNSCCPLL